MYKNWTTQNLEILEKLRWYSVIQTIDYLHQARTFIIVQQQFVKASPPLLQCCKFPAGERERFPLNDCYICESIGHWHVKLDIIQLNLHSILNEKWPIDRVRFMQKESLQLINELLKLFERKTDTLTQSQFEARYQLTWQEEDLANHTIMHCNNPFCYSFGYIASILAHFMSSVKLSTIRQL